MIRGPPKHYIRSARAITGDGEAPAIGVAVVGLNPENTHPLACFCEHRRRKGRVDAELARLRRDPRPVPSESDKISDTDLNGLRRNVAADSQNVHLPSPRFPPGVTP